MIEEWSSVPDFVLGFLKQVGEIASGKNLNLFVAGGFVRDLLLGVKNLDLDLVVEKDGIAFASVLAEVLHGTVRPHEKFQTARLLLPSGFKVDVATARKESYAYPAALPQVVPASIKEDLFRRDFTINAMAFQLNPPVFGKLIDFFGGRKDLRARFVRILHKASFVDDPTRIFRAVRFQQRYGFKMEKETERLLKEALSSGLIGQLSAERVSRELFLIFSEKNPFPILKQMESLGILSLIHRSLTLPSPTILVMESLPNVFAEFKALMAEEPFEDWIVTLTAFLSSLPLDDLREVLRKFYCPEKDKEKLSLLKKNWREILRALSVKENMPASMISKKLNSFSLEGVLFLYAASNSALARKRIRDYLVFSRKVKLLVTGEDLLSLGLAPSPLYGELLEKVKCAQLDGLVRTKKEALDLILKEVQS